jgi:hypothetical protein
MSIARLVLPSGAHVKPRHAGDDGRRDRWRPPLVAPGREVLIPPFGDTAHLSQRSLSFGLHPPSCDHVGRVR